MSHCKRRATLRLTVYRSGNRPTLKAGWNTYPDHAPSGAYLVVRRRVFSLRWAHLSGPVSAGGEDR
jgi:hypothetical protein